MILNSVSPKTDELRKHSVFSGNSLAAISVDFFAKQALRNAFGRQRVHFQRRFQAMSKRCVMLRRQKGAHWRRFQMAFLERRLCETTPDVIWAHFSVDFKRFLETVAAKRCHYITISAGLQRNWWV